MRLVVNIQGGNLTDIEEVGPGHFRARMQPEPNSVYPYPVHQLCWFICRFEGVPQGGADAQLTLVNCEWRPEAFRTQRPFLCYDADWQRSENWSHRGLIGVQLDSTKSESARAGVLPALTAAPSAPLITPAAPMTPPTAVRHTTSTPAAAPAVPAPAAPSKTPAAKAGGAKTKPQTATLSLFPAENDPSNPPTAPVPTPAPTAQASSTTMPTSRPIAAPENLGPLRPDFTGGTVTYRFHLTGDCTVALHPPYTHEHCHADLERWGMSPDLHYQRLGASHGGRSFFVVEAARHRAKGVNPQLPFAVLLVREHGVDAAVNWVLRGLIDRLLTDPAVHTLDRLSLIVFPFVNQDAAYLGRTVDPHTGLDLSNDFGRNPAAMPATPAGGGAPEFKLPESRMVYRYVADQLRAGRRCLGAISLQQPHGPQENVGPIYYLGPARHCQDPAFTALQRALHQHTRRFTHATPDFWPSRVCAGRFDHDFGIPALTLEINPHCARHPLSLADLQQLGGELAVALAAWAATA